MNEFWFYIAVAEYVMIAVFIQMQLEEWPSDKWQQVGGYIALFLWPTVFIYLIGRIIWQSSRKLVSKLLSVKR